DLHRGQRPCLPCCQDGPKWWAALRCSAPLPYSPNLTTTAIIISLFPLSNAHLRLPSSRYKLTTPHNTSFSPSNPRNGLLRVRLLVPYLAPPPLRAALANFGSRHRSHPRGATDWRNQHQLCAPENEC
ncbi:hypothetical protein BC567DRAFT_178250, partial [Phyllosticta citribraziliensis]